MRRVFETELRILNENLIYMGALCEQAIETAIQKLTEAKSDDKVNIKQLEEQIGRQRRDIEMLCTRLILQQQPVAKDLRHITSVFRMIADMERIGIQAVDIYEIVSEMEDTSSGNQINVYDMAIAAAKMVTDSIDAFVRQDLELAKHVQEYDDVVDSWFFKIKDELAATTILERLTSKSTLDLLMIAKYLEKIGDHAVNIAEWVEYAITGKSI